ncbi:MAG: glycine/betaine ABC transporter substrate-binding protein [Clostridiales bacterium]|nr:glycine/betaine ABC transporter substrate-binding protein [Clostridiales bacterium]
MKKWLLTLALPLILILPLLLGSCGSGNTITIGSKDFSENILLGEIFAQLIEAKTDLKVNRKLNMGGTFVNFEAIKNNQIDIYPEYTGTALTAQLGMEVISDPDETYNVVAEEFDSRFGIKWLEPLGFNNTYAIAVTEKIYQETGAKTISELISAAPELIFGAEHEFFDREDGFDGLIATYGLNFKGDPLKMNVSLKYQAMDNGDIDVTDVFATDGNIMKYNLKILEDDKGFFPPYYAAPIIRNKTLEKYPELEEILNSLAGLFDDETMTALNYKIDVEGMDIAAVAKEFLEENNLI